MYSFHINHDHAAGPTPRSMLPLTPIYHRNQHTSSNPEDESDLDYFPMRGSRTYLDIIKRRVDRRMELSVDTCDPHTEGGNNDWALMFYDPFFGNAYRFRMADGPSIGEPWRFEFEWGCPNPFPTPTRRHFITRMPERQCHRIYATARRTQGRFCQQWVIDVIRDLESQSLVPPGKGTELTQFLETDLYPEVQVSYDDQLSIIEKERAGLFGNPVLHLNFGRSHWRANILNRLEGRIVQQMLRMGLDFEIQIRINDKSDRIEATWLEWTG
ncbi:hypothetical protein FSPOR_1091 [Fusarium sporotrichioides]|uniref:Uncharacterized protein n=1 Tax=Fusarium sporotrichioides TaxID=5514 RepID=A0A395SR19_FUSSP|nr:hypothetical protein FSPOR_1091 [Fusarium sporotrichioides]